MKKDLVVAAIQLTSGPLLQRNLATSRMLIESAVEQGAEVVLLPENFSYFGPPEGKASQIDVIDEDTRRFLHDCARGCNITLIAGGVPSRTAQGRIVNVALVYDSSGLLINSYEKMHVFDAVIAGRSYEESKTTQPGEVLPQSFSLPNGMKAAVAVCYDLRFPELFRCKTTFGCEVYFLGAAFTPTTGAAHWEILLRTRAVENTAYVVAAAQVGQHFSGRVSYGDTIVVNPWGEVVDRLANGEGTVVAEVSARKVLQIRSALPVLDHCRIEPYRSFSKNLVRDAD
jgi:deaminated glutathione amidase